MSFPIFVMVIFTILKLTNSSPSCAAVTHSDCVDDDSHIFVEVTTANQEACKLICTSVGDKCHFSLFDKESYARGNCRLYDISFSRFVLQCNELAGPRELPEGCDLENPEDNTCQVYRRGKCDFGRVEENNFLSSWQNCHLSCLSTSQCQLWRFEEEEGLCKILYSRESSCSWEFSPREPSSDACGNPKSSTTTTSTSPTTPPTTTQPHPSCDVPNTQNYGDWFCPPSSNPYTCHLECDPGYVSDDGTVITCYNGEWSSTPTCVAAVCLITGPYNTVEIYGEALHKKLPDLPEVRVRHSLDLINSEVLLCGGGNTETSCLALTSSLQWSLHSTTSSSRYSHSSASMLGQLHLLGGYESQSTTEVLTPPSNQWHHSWDLLESAWASCAAKIEPQLFIMTGGVFYPSSVVSYNVTSGEATRLQDLIKGRYEHGCVYLKERSNKMRGLLVAGGSADSNAYLSTSEIYDLTTGKWSTAGDLTSGRQGVRMVVLGNNALAMGGQEGINHFSSVDRFNLTSRQWTVAENMLEERMWHAVTPVPPSAVGNGQR